MKLFTRRRNVALVLALSIVAALTAVNLGGGANAATPERLRYVALGDSYSAGEGAGAGNYFQWHEARYRCTNRNTGVTKDRLEKPYTNWDCTEYQQGYDIACHRAPTAWSWPLADWAEQLDFVTNVACSGAKIFKNLACEPRRDSTDCAKSWLGSEQAQVEELRHIDERDAVDLVTFTIGGNDVGFGGIVGDCFKPNLVLGGTCKDAQLQVEHRLQKLDLVEPLRQIRDAAPHAVIAYVGYPQVVPSSQDDTLGCGWLGNDERLAVRGVVDTLNAAAANAVRTAQAENINAVYVSIRGALVGHELCTAESHMIQVTGNKFNSEQAHPDSVDRSSFGGTSGQQDIAFAVYKQLIELRIIDGGGTPTTIVNSTTSTSVAFSPTTTWTTTPI